MPNVKLTEAFIRSIESDGSKDVYYNDVDQHGLCLMIRKGGRRVYCFRGRDARGVQIKRIIDDADRISLVAARKVAKAWSNRLAMGEDPFAEKKMSRAKTFSDVYDAWLKWSEEHPTDPSAYGVRKSMSNYRNALSYFDNYPLDQINKPTVEDYRAKQSAMGKKNASVNRYITELKFLAKWAVDHGIISEHKLKDVKRIHELDSVPKTHHFTDDERNLFIETVKEASEKIFWGRRMAYLWPLTYLLMHTGIRKQSALGLIWSDIDFEKGLIRLRAANIKTKKDALLPLSQRTLEILKEWKPQTTGKDEDPLFPGDGTQLKDVKKQFKRLFAKAGLDKKYSVNSLRHDFASELLARKVNISTVQMLLVHTDPRTTMKYAHPSEDHLRENVNKLDD